MLKRKKYIKEDRDKAWSIKDEPVYGSIRIEKKDREYPDMYNAYKQFAEIYKLSENQFILANGCENALRIVLEAIRPYYMYIENPSWGLVEILANGLLYPRPDETKELQRIFKVNYKYIDNKFILDKNIENLSEKSSAFYVTQKYNNMFEHEPLNAQDDFAKYTIIDETYSAEFLLDDNRVIPENVFIIGSYSKFWGAGIRLGYVLYHPKWNDLFQLLREECISELAVKYTNKKIPDIQLPEYNNSFICKSNNYIVVKAEDYNGDKARINREFEISGIKFYKLGLLLK